MNYDKESFVAGITVGRQLKGWATERINSNGELSATMAIGGGTVAVLNPALALTISGFTTQVLSAFAYISTGEIEVDIGTHAIPTNNFVANIGVSIEKQDVPTFADSITVLSPVLDGTITAHADLEVITE